MMAPLQSAGFVHGEKYPGGSFAGRCRRHGGELGSILIFPASSPSGLYAAL
jgi:hypothetical protein